MLGSKITPYTSIDILLTPHTTKYYVFYSQNITDAMKTVCEILTADPEGGPARIPFQLFQDLYRYLAHIDGEISQEHLNNVISHLEYHV